MRLIGLELLTLDLSLRQGVVSAVQTHDRRPVLLVRVFTNGAEGWGESGALALGTSVDPPLDLVRRSLVEVAIPRLVRAVSARGGELPAASQVRLLFSTEPSQQMAAAALEMAILDAELRDAGESLARRLAVSVDRVTPGALVGIPEDHRLDVLLAQVGELEDRGFKRVRVKIGPGWDVEPLRALRGQHPHLVLQADANGAYRLGSGEPDDARRLLRLDPLGLACLEQPLAPADLQSHAALAQILETPIGLDESLTSPRRLVDALRYGACEVACLKPSRLGGLLTARQAHDICVEAEVAAFVGGFFETGLGRRAHLALAGLPGFTLPGDLSSPTDYLVEDPFSYPELMAGQLPVPQGPGIAGDPDAEVLARCTVNQEQFAYAP